MATKITQDSVLKYIYKNKFSNLLFTRHLLTAACFQQSTYRITELFQYP